MAYAAMCCDIRKAHVSNRPVSILAPYSPIQKPTDLYDDPHLLASGGLLEMTEPGGQKVVVPGLPMRVDGERYGVRCDPPAAGADSDAILQAIGVDAGEVARLRAKGIVGG